MARRIRLGSEIVSKLRTDKITLVVTTDICLTGVFFICISQNLVIDNSKKNGGKDTIRWVKFS